MDRRTFIAAGAGGPWLAAAPAMAADAGVSDKEVLLGNTGILSGPLGENIKQVLAGADLAFAEANRRGGVAGRQLRVVSLDDELKPEKAVANYQSLLAQHKVFAFFGCVGSGTTAAAAKVLADSGAPMVAGYAVADSARDKVHGSAYFVRATTGREAQALVQHLTTIGVTKIAVAHLDNPGGQEVLRLVEAALAEFQLKPGAAAAIKGDGSNVAAAARPLADPQIQAVIVYLGGALGGELMKAIWALDSRPKFYGMSIVPGDVTAKVLGDRVRGLAISQVVPYPWADIDPLAQEYRRLADAAKLPAGYYSYEGFINGRVMLEALGRCGRDLTRAKLHASLRSLKMRLSGLSIDFTNGSHTGSRFVDLVQVTIGGRFLR